MPRAVDVAGMAREYQVLVCDDDPEVCAAMRRTLHRYGVTTVGSTAEALTELRLRPYHAVLSDFDLSAASDGLELLQIVRLLYPETVRFLITGDPDLNVAIRAVNEGSVHRFFRKPWDPEQLVATMELQIRTRRADTAEVAP